MPPSPSPTPRAYRIEADPGVRVLLASLGLACCALEVESAVRLGLLVPEHPADRSPQRTVVLVTGTVTDALVPAIRAVVDGLPPDTQVVSFGACAATGGPYWDAPTVAKGVDQFVRVTAYIPGCPPRPDALVAGLRSLVAGGVAS